MNASEIARKADVAVDTVRYYTRVRLLNPTKAAHNGYHQYDAEDLRRLTFIRKAKQLGFSLDDIRQILALADAGKSPCQRVRQLLETRLAEARQEIERALSMYATMRLALEQWRHMPDGMPSQHAICHLIENCDRPIGRWDLDQWLSEQQEQADESDD
jgi:DNA-binding transcriptional MerR regulator